MKSQSEQILGMKKSLFLTKVFFKDKKVRKLPFKFMLFLNKMLKYEKFTKIGDKQVIFSQVPPYPSRAFDRYIDGLISTSNGKHVPLSLEFAITNMCKYKCWHCSNEYRSGKELKLDKLLDIIHKFQELGVVWVGLSGGEPLLRKDIVDIIQGIDDRSYTAIFTTGYGLTKKLAKDLKNAGLFCFVISIDSANPEVHDKLRGFKGAFNIAVEAIRISKSLGFYTVVSTVATKENINNGELEKLLKFLYKNNVDECRILEIVPTGKIINQPDLALDDADRDILYKIHMQANTSKTYPRVSAFPYLERPELLGCTGGYQHLTIDPLGNVCPCPFTPISLGNVAIEKVEVVWERYKRCFKNPLDKCLYLHNYEKISTEFNNSLPLSVEASMKICKSTKADRLPVFYKKLGLKEDRQK
jgi:MoaA/NifB/PqqE/SkfB family radical SAM enzyme